MNATPLKPLPPSEPIPAWKKRLPMQLTWGRMAVCPLIVGLLVLGGPIDRWIAAGLFIAASITDWFDGYFARKYKAISSMGKFMDPIADKILVASTLIMLIPLDRVGPIVVLLLLVRDILIGGIRAVAATDNLVIDAKATGKWKTGLQMVAIPAILVDVPFDLPLLRIGQSLLWFSVVLSLLSGWQYVQMYRESRTDSLT